MLHFASKKVSLFARWARVESSNTRRAFDISRLGTKDVDALIESSGFE
jgi:hypothetical protein